MCTLVGCGEAVEMCVPLVTTPHIRVCRNELCTEVVRGATEVYLKNEIGPVYQFEGCIATDISEAARDGDIYTLTGFDANGDVVDEYRWTATYEAYYPNGEECGPECLRPSLTVVP
ncbi:MAG: hypothetical protein ACKV2T_07960 [Kofleriaceae bacterium]